MHPGIIVGAYAASPTLAAWEPDLESAFFQALAGTPGLRGLELPWIDGLHPHDPDWLLTNLLPAWDLVLTTVAHAVRRVSGHPQWGLASPDAGARRDALADVSRVRADVVRLNDAAGRRAVVAVELHAPPATGYARAEDLARSLDEILSWDWEGASLVIEHCDARRPDREPQKGWLELEATLRAVLATGGRVGIVINWARSVIEGRHPAEAVIHIEAAQAAGVLAGLVLSGVAAEPGESGAAWEDRHLPFARSETFPWGDPTSLLTRERAREAVLAAGSLEFLGLKMSARPDLTLAQRGAMIADAVRETLSLTAPESPEA